MKKVFIVTVVICMIILQITAFGALDTNLTWTYEPWWYMQSEDTLGINNPSGGGKFLYSNETHTGTQSFTYQLTFTADVEDENVRNYGWDQLDVYLAVDGIPQINGADAENLPGYKDDQNVYHGYDALFIRIKRYPASSDATIKLCKVVDEVYTEITEETLAAEQRANGYVFDLSFKYEYASDTNNTLTVYLGDEVVATLQDCDDLIDGRFSFQTIHTKLLATKVVYTETTNKTEPTTEPTTAPATEPVSNPSTGDMSLLILATIIAAATVITVSTRKKMI